MKAEARAKNVIERMKYSTVSIRYVFDLNVIKDNEKSLTDFGGIPLLDIDVSPMDGVVGRTMKNIEDKILAALILTLLSPLLLVLAVGVKLSSPGPVFYRQVRISWNNQPFTMLKFRSMPVQAHSGPKQASSVRRNLALSLEKQALMNCRSSLTYCLVICPLLDLGLSDLNL